MATEKYEFKGTKGPWVIENNRVISTNDNYNSHVAICSLPQYKGKLKESPYMVNAHLIAAAPDLLYACIQVFDQYYLTEWEKDVRMQRIKSAIEKALNINQ